MDQTLVGQSSNLRCRWQVLKMPLHQGTAQGTNWAVCVAGVQSILCWCCTLSLGLKSLGTRSWVKPEVTTHHDMCTSQKMAMLTVGLTQPASWCEWASINRCVQKLTCPSSWLFIVLQQGIVMCRGSAMTLTCICDLVNTWCIAYFELHHGQESSHCTSCVCLVVCSLRASHPVLSMRMAAFVFSRSQMVGVPRRVLLSTIPCRVTFQLHSSHVKLTLNATCSGPFATFGTRTLVPYCLQRCPLLYFRETELGKHILLELLFRIMVLYLTYCNRTLLIPYQMLTEYRRLLWKSSVVERTTLKAIVNNRMQPLTPLSCYMLRRITQILQKCPGHAGCSFAASVYADHRMLKWAHAPTSTSNGCNLSYRRPSWLPCSTSPLNCCTPCDSGIKDSVI